MMWHNLLGRQPECEVERDESAELEGDQLSPTDPQLRLQLLCTRHSSVWLKD